MEEPTFADYVRLLYTLFEQFAQTSPLTAQRGRPFVYKHKVLIVFFLMMQFRRIFCFKAQVRWLRAHPADAEEIGLFKVPHRTTLSRRYRKLHEVVQAFVAFVGEQGKEYDPRFASDHLFEDASLFKASGPVWHQSDRKEERIPEGLRRLDTDASWGKSAYQGWVYGYGLHLTCNPVGFPVLVQVETATVKESQVIDDKQEAIFNLQPETVTGDNAYTQATRIRCWARQQVALLTPAKKWKKGRYARAYQHFLRQPQNQAQLQQRRSCIEPVFDRIAKVLGATDNQKQLPLQFLPKVRPCLLLATLALQVAMIINSVFGLPLRNIATMAALFS